MSSSSEPPAAAPASAPAAVPRRWWALGALCLAVLVIGFDSTVLNVALPDIAVQLHAGTGQLQWIVDAYLVVFAAAMLPAGLLGDRFGRRRLLIAGLTLFLAASLVGTFADSPATLIAVRAGMGLGGALIMPLAMSIVPNLFPSDERGRAVAVMTTGTALGLPLGPIIGGLLLNHFWWGSIFLINVPLIAVGILALVLLVPESRNPAVPRVDPVSALLGTAGLAALTFGFIQAPSDGWGSPLIVGMLVASVLLLGGLVLRERSEEHPMLDLTLLADRVFRWSTIATVLVTAVLMGALFVLPQYLQSVLGYDALGTGVRLMPLMLGLIVAARLSERLVAAVSARWVISSGLLLVAAAMFLGSLTGSTDGYGWTAIWLTVLGLGMGLTMVPAMGAAMTALPADRSGVGSGLLQTLRQSAGAIGVALLGALLAGIYTGRLDTSGLPGPLAHTARGSVSAAQAVADQLHSTALAASAHSAFLHGMTTVLLVCGITAVLSAALIALRMPGAAGRAARQEGRDIANGAADHAQSVA